MRRTTKAGSSLVGALIGLVRATDGASHVTDDTYNIIIEGLHISDIALNIPEFEIKAMTDKAHADKHRLVPDCSVCTAPCGRTDDYDWESVYEAATAKEEIAESKIEILAALQTLTHDVKKGQGKNDKDTLFLMCRAVFSLGEQWTAGELRAVLAELKNVCGT